MKFLCGVVAVVLLAGCGRKDAPPPPATQPAASRPAPTPATLDVAGEPVTFPVVSLDAGDEGGSVRVVLAGSDGLSPSRQSFYFVARPDADTSSDLPGQVWRWKKTEDEEIDGAIGVFMEGNALRFLPVEMNIEFGGKWPDLTVTVNGKLLRDGDESKPVTLKGTYTVRANERKR